MKIIDPKSDLGFKTILVDQPDIFIDVVNSLIPLPKPVVDVTYISAELLPEINGIKNTIIDAYCMDTAKRHFMVEMQVAQQSNFIQRTLLNASKIYSRQIFQGGKYNALQPVYSINLLNHIMDTKTDLWHHEYKLRHHKFHKRSLNDLTLHFFELPKWQKINKFDMNNPLDRWMQFFTNPNFYTMISLEERQILDKIYSAVDLLNTKNYTIEQLRGYDQFIDNIMIRETDLDEAEKRGELKGELKGKKKEQMEIYLIISELKKMELTIEQIANKCGVTEQKVYEVKSLIF
jgi:predicted transposase/invertase (TIGR01784 family)